jgi:hypothetical protein
MKLKYRMFLLIVILSSNTNFAQKTELNFLGGMKYASYNGPDASGYAASSAINKLGLTTLSNNDSEWPKEAQLNECLVGYWNLIIKSGFGSGAKANLQISNCLGEVVYDNTNTASGYAASFDRNVNTASERAFENFKNVTYTYDKSLTKIIAFPEVENINMTENEIKTYLDSSKLDPIEGIFKSYKSDVNYKVGIIKVGDNYKAIIIDSDYPQWKKGDVKAVFESTAAEGVFAVNYFMGDKTSLETFANVEGGLINIEMKDAQGEGSDMNLLKLYPKN